MQYSAYMTQVHGPLISVKQTVRDRRIYKIYLRRDLPAYEVYPAHMIRRAYYYRVFPVFFIHDIFRKFYIVMSIYGIFLPDYVLRRNAKRYGQRLHDPNFLNSVLVS